MKAECERPFKWCCDMSLTGFFILFLVFSFQAEAQSSQLPKNYDSLVRKVMKIDAAINTMHSNLIKSHEEFKAGTIILIGGIVISVVGTQVKQAQSGQPLVIFGGIVATVGGIIQIDSHKFIGKGARRKTPHYQHD